MTLKKKSLKNILLVLLLAGINSLFGQSPNAPSDFGLKEYHITDENLGEVNFYVTKNDIQSRKPLLLLLDGSGHLPLYSLIRKSDGSSVITRTIPFRFNSLSKDYHVVLIGKPGTPFIDSLNAQTFNEFKQQYKPSKTYNQKLSLEWRVNSASRVIDYLTDELKTGNDIIAVGYSEGGQVVPKLALINNKVTKIVNIVGGGLNQFNDFITAERLKAQKGIISADSAQVNIDSLYSKFQDIYNSPKATDKFWLGHTYKRWAGFCKDIPLENMIQLEIPILLIAGGLDENSPITGLDYVKLEFIRQQKNNLTYKVYPNCDHWFNDQQTKSSRLHEMMDFVIKWIEK